MSILMKLVKLSDSACYSVLVFINQPNTTKINKWESYRRNEWTPVLDAHELDNNYVHHVKWGNKHLRPWNINYTLGVNQNNVVSKRDAMGDLW